MRSCRNCFNCVTRVTLEPTGGNVKLLKNVPYWANLRFVFHEVKCRAGLWKHEKGDKDRVYKNFMSLPENPSLFAHAANCPQYDG